MKAKRAKKLGAKQGAAIFNRRQSHDRATARSTQMGHKRHSANGDATAIENRRSLKYSRPTFERLRSQGTLAVFRAPSGASPSPSRLGSHRLLSRSHLDLKAVTPRRQPWAGDTIPFGVVP